MIRHVVISIMPAAEVVHLGECCPCLMRGEAPVALLDAPCYMNWKAMRCVIFRKVNCKPSRRIQVDASKELRNGNVLRTRNALCGLGLHYLCPHLQGLPHGTL